MFKENFKILIAEDDLNLGVLLMEYLQCEGYAVKLARNGDAALKAFHEQAFDLCLLDVMLPEMDGYSLAENIRSLNSKIPLIFITAKSLKEDKLRGYSCGADDYITKPFDEEELLWKIQAVLRRLPATKNQIELIGIGSYVFDYSNQSLARNGSLKRITEKECEILKYLSDRRNRLVKRQELLKALWGGNDYFTGRSLDVFITKIRKYLREDPSLSIENVFKVGFIFNIPNNNHKLSKT